MLILHCTAIDGHWTAPDEAIDAGMTSMTCAFTAYSIKLVLRHFQKKKKSSANYFLPCETGKLHALCQ
jgi:hypothetical protein